MSAETNTMKAAREAEERRAKIVKLAREKLEKEGELEISPEAEVSDGDDNGCYVAAWVWMPFGGTEFDKEKAE